MQAIHYSIAVQGTDALAHHINFNVCMDEYTLNTLLRFVTIPVASVEAASLPLNSSHLHHSFWSPPHWLCISMYHYV